MPLSTSPFPGANIDRNLKKPTAPGKAPKLRLHDPNDAYQIAATLVRAAIARVEKGRMIRGLIDGNPPHSPSAIRRQAQGWRANFNTLEPASLVATAKTPYYDLFSATNPLVDPELDTDRPERDQWNRIAAEEFHCMVHSYHSLESVLWTMLDDFVVFNKGFLWWPDPFDPFFKRLEWQRVMFPNGTGLDPDDWNQFAVRQYWTVTKLWSVSRGGTGPYWNGDATVAAIQRARVIIPRSQQAEGMMLQQELKDCDVLVAAKSEVVRTVSIFTREYDGKWSWHMVEEDAAMQAVPLGTEPPPKQDQEEPRFMFAAPRVFDSPWEILSPFIYEAQEGSINAFTGLGKQIYQLCRGKMIIQMGLLDGAILRQYPMIQPASAADAQKASLLQAGPLHILAPGAQVIQTNLMADLEGSLAVLQHLDNQVEANTAIFRARQERTQGNPESATSASLRFQKETQLTSSAVDRFYAQGDRWIAEVWRRATADLPSGSSKPGIKAAREFQERCKERGVPLDVLRKKPYELRLSRAIGNGSPLARQQALMSVALGVPELGPRGRRAYWEMLYTATLGSRAAAKLLPQDDILGLPDTNTWMAEQENGYMKENGVEPTITDGQDARVHAQSHLMAAQGALQAVQQGADPMVALNFIPVALSHSGKHVATLPKDSQGPFVQAIQQIDGGYQQLAQAVQQQQADQQRRQQKAQKMLSDQDVAMLKVQLDAQQKEAKNQAQMQQRQERHQQDAALADASTATDINLKAATTKADIAAKTAKTAADIEATKLKARAAANKPKPKA